MLKLIDTFRYQKGITKDTLSTVNELINIGIEWIKEKGYEDGNKYKLEPEVSLYNINKIRYKIIVFEKAS